MVYCASRFSQDRKSIPFKDLYKILFKKTYIQSKNEVLDLLNKLLVENDDDLILKEMKSNFLSDKSKHIGQVSLWNKPLYKKLYENRLQGEKPRK